MQRLQGKRAIITGGSTGIGRTTCELFAREGASVVVAALDKASGLATAEQLSAQGGKAIGVVADVANEASVQSLVEQTAAALGGIDIVVNNAGIFLERSIEATTEEWNRLLSVNVIGPALMVKHAAPLMKQGGGGAIVNVCSISSFIAQPRFLVYSATKAALANMTRCMALDLAASRIRVNAVCPGPVWTQMVADLAKSLNRDRAAMDSDPDYGGGTMLQRVAEPIEVARAILFLASDDASYITGENLMVDAGYTAR